MSNTTEFVSPQSTTVVRQVLVGGSNHTNLAAPQLQPALASPLQVVTGGPNSTDQSRCEICNVPVPRGDLGRAEHQAGRKHQAVLKGFREGQGYGDTWCKSCLLHVPQGNKANHDLGRRHRAILNGTNVGNMSSQNIRKQLREVGKTRNDKLEGTSRIIFENKSRSRSRSRCKRTYQSTSLNINGNVFESEKSSTSVKKSRSRSGNNRSIIREDLDGEIGADVIKEGGEVEPDVGRKNLENNVEEEQIRILDQCIEEISCRSGNKSRSIIADMDGETSADVIKDRREVESDMNRKHLVRKEQIRILDQCIEEMSSKTKEN